MLATAFVALAFDPVQTRLEEFASRTVHGGQPSPYDVLRGFSGTLTGSYAVEELPARMARVLADGTGAVWSQVWVVVGRSTRPGRQLAAGGRPRSGVRGRGPAGRERTRPVLPPGPVRRGPARRPGDPGTARRAPHQRRATPVRRPGQSGRAGPARYPPARRARAPAERAVRARGRAAGLAAAPGRRPGQRPATASSATSTTAPSSTWSRWRSTCDSRTPSRPARRSAPWSCSPPRRPPRTTPSRRWSSSPAASIRRCSRTQASPPPSGARSAARSAAVEIVEGELGRYALGVEAAAYFTCLEAVQNAAKHSGASAIRVELRGEPDALTLDGVRRRRRVRPGHDASGRRPGQHARPGRVRRRDPHHRIGARPRDPDPRRRSPHDRWPSPTGAAEMRARVAWCLAGLTLVAVVADAVITAQYRPLGPRPRWRGTASRSSAEPSSAPP